MNKWIKTEDVLPCKACKILVYIEGNIFVGEAFPHGPIVLGKSSENAIDFEFDNQKKYPFTIGGEDFTISTAGMGWIIPNHFKEPSHWMYIEEPKS